MLLSNRKLRLDAAERDCMRKAGRFNAQLMDALRPLVKAGSTTGEIDRFVHEYTVSHGHRPAQLGYVVKKIPFPKSCCTSVNDVICHGIPGTYVLKDGDIVSVDLTTVVEGWHADQCETFLIGEPSPIARSIVQCALDCLYLAIDAIEPGCRVSEIGEAVVAEAARYKFSVVEEFVGHGVGRQFHQKPSIPHAPTRQARQERLEPGLCFTIEPMINSGSRYTTQEDKKDGWTVRTKDGGLSAQFEHTILMTETGPEILTRTHLGPQKGHKF